MAAFAGFSEAAPGAIFAHNAPSARVKNPGCRWITLVDGVAGFWDGYTDRYDISLLNLPRAFERFSAVELAPFRIIEADACECHLPAGTFDIAFSNALIEHVGNARRQKLLADFIRSSSNGFWVQTPSPFFPIEAHCDMPFWWFTSLDRRRRIISKWNRESRKFLAKQMASTRPIWPGQLRRLFPDSEILREHFVGLPKSQIAYRKLPI
ncbi:class I SAM-dependent methyltransferase [uncultured Bradyrhizobium sp.]|jgi:SAM-dependent methyltransferase|uniref:class I SAM-dependent methyltransferase n=1 Tax=uncultured Bradyrhizobium sp. TaxID=199684 RepID=UPI0026354258|nr:class I SAM-dependent methyltransferase [uncultured Bradyrhizobium sp.]